MDPISSTPFLPVQAPKSKIIVAFPKDGIEYVQNVMIERKKCSDIVSADYDSKINKCQNVFATLLPKTVAAPDPLLPTKEWQIIQESDFSQVRCRLSCIKNQRDFWKKPDELPKENSTSHWKMFLANHSPLLSIVFSMSQAQLELAFSILVEELEDVSSGNGIERKCGQWIFAILAAFQLPLMPNLVSQLRDLARRCSQIRSKLRPDAEDVLSTVAPLNLFICLVARYFNQGDLAD